MHVLHLNQSSFTARLFSFMSWCIILLLSRSFRFWPCGLVSRPAPRHLLYTGSEHLQRSGWRGGGFGPGARQHCSTTQSASTQRLCGFRWLSARDSRDQPQLRPSTLPGHWLTLKVQHTLVWVEYLLFAQSFFDKQAEVVDMFKPCFPPFWFLHWLSFDWGKNILAISEFSRFLCRCLSINQLSFNTFFQKCLSFVEQRKSKKLTDVLK